MARRSRAQPGECRAIRAPDRRAGRAERSRDDPVVDGTGERIGAEDRFSGEKVSPVLTLWTWSDFDEIQARVGRILKFSGEGHTAAIHSERADRALAVALQLNVGRVSHNLPHAFTNSGGWASGPVTVSLGGGTWAGNMTSDNINWRHFLNYTWLASPIAEYVPTDEELFGEYLSTWGRD